jgi:hypothetical protein
VEEVTLRRSELRSDWEDLLSAEDIAAWASKGATKPLREKLPTEPGVYRWLFPGDGSAKPRAYVGEGENLRLRMSDYLQAAVEPVTSATENSFTEEGLRKAIKAIHRCSVIRIGEYLARKSSGGRVQLQRLRIAEEAIICGVEISSCLFDDKIGRVFLEHWAVLSTENEGYMMLNRSPHGRNVPGKKLWRKLHSKRKATRKFAFEGARL